MFLGFSVPSMFPSQSSYQHGLPLLGRLRVPSVTRRLCSYSALRLPYHPRSQLRFPSPSTYLFGGCFFLAGTREHPLSRSRRRFRSTGSPSCRCSPEEWPGPPRFLGRPFRARHGRTPRQVCHPLAPLLVMALLPSGILAPWAPGIHSFRGRLPVAHTLAGLRIAVTVTRIGARPCFRPAGLGFGRVGFSPTGRHTEFQSVSPPPSFRTSLAWSLPISPSVFVGERPLDPGSWVCASQVDRSDFRQGGIDAPLLKYVHYVSNPRWEVWERMPRSLLAGLCAEPPPLPGRSVIRGF